MNYTMTYQERVVLEDGAILDLRAIQPSDKAALSEGFDRLSMESRRRRFFASKSSLSDSELHYFTEIDGVDHYSIVAVVPTAGDDAEKGAGVVRIVRTEEDPEIAELAIVIADCWQRRGVGRRLLERIVAAAAERGIKKICATSLSDNEQIRGLFNQYDGGVVLGPTQPGELHFTLSIPPPNQLDILDSMIDILRRAVV